MRLSRRSSVSTAKNEDVAPRDRGKREVRLGSASRAREEEDGDDGISMHR